MCSEFVKKFCVQSLRNCVSRGGRTISLGAIRRERREGRGRVAVNVRAEGGGGKNKYSVDEKMVRYFKLSICLKKQRAV